MHPIRNIRLLQIAGLLLSVLVWLANSDNPTNGTTGAPFDGTCTSCHSDGNVNNFNGTIAISGMPAVVEPNTVYPLLLTMTPTAGSSVRGGFQLVAVDGSDDNAGNLAASNAQTGTEISGSREYLENRGAKNFIGGGPASWSFNWTSPAVAAGGQIKFYLAGAFGNNNASETGDFILSTSSTYTFNGASEPVTAAITGATNVSCNGGNDGSATVTAAGGTPPYSYAWSDGQTTATAINLDAGAYTVTVTGSSGSGTATASLQITEPNAISVNTNVSGVITCVEPSATITASAQGGTPPYTYVWVNAMTAQTTIFMPGAYTVTVSDANGCTKTATALVNSNISVPIANILPSPTLTCASPTLTLSGAGSSTGANFTYQWTTTNGNIVSGNSSLSPTVDQCGTYRLEATNVVNGCTSTATTTVVCDIDPPQNVTAVGGVITCADPMVTLSASSSTPGVVYSWSGPCIDGNNQNQQNPAVCLPGTYTVVVTNPISGCTNQADAIVIQLTADITASTSTTDALCFGAASGAAFVSASGGVEPYSYLWSNDETTQTISDLTAGTYTVTVADAGGCSTTASATIVQPTALQVIITTTAESDFGLADGTATATATGGTPGYTYLWNTSATTATIGNLVPSTYTVTVTDSNGCTVVKTGSVANADCALTIEMIATPVKCFGSATGTATAIVSGATGNLSYEWSNNATTETTDSLFSGVYTVTATDAAGCTIVGSAEITQPATALVVLVTDLVQVDCPLDQNGSALPVISGGWGAPYTFQFSWGLGGFNNLSAGSYSFTVTDQQGCEEVATFEISAQDTIPPALQCPDNFVLCGADLLDYATPTVTDNCAGGPIEAMLIEGFPSGSAFLDGVTTQVFSATDASGNTSTCSFTVTVYPVSDILINSIENDSDGSGTGSIDVEPAGDSGPFTFVWEKDGDFFAETEDLTGLFTGTYTLVMTDVNGCTVQLAPIFIDNVVATNGVSSEIAHIKLLPNPAQRAFRLEMSQIEPVSMEILNAQGQVVRTLESAEWTSEVSVDILPTGFYYLKVMSRRGVCHVVKWAKIN